MEINSKLLKVRFLKSKETIISSYRLKFPLTNTLKIKSQQDSSPNSNPYSLSQSNNRANLRLRLTL